MASMLLNSTCRSTFTANQALSQMHKNTKTSISPSRVAHCVAKSSSNKFDQPAISRRHAEALLIALAAAGLNPSPSQAIGFKKELKKRKLTPEDYTNELANGLKYIDLNPGSGKEVSPGSEVTVHYDCVYKGIDVVSSRSARLLGGNRTVAEPFQFIAGEPVSAKVVKAVGDSAGGLFSGMGGPKPPPALSTAVVGMKAGGTRSVLVPPELGYGDRGEQEIGPGQTFELKIEVLSIP